MRLLTRARVTMAAVAVLTLAACGGDGDGGNGPGNDGNINATYDLVTVAGIELPADAGDGTTLVGGTIDFDSDGTFTADLDWDGTDDESTSGTYTIDGTTVSMTDDEGTVTGTFSNNQGTLTVVEQGVSLVYKK